MRNIFSKIIILFNVFVGVFCVLMSASVMADYVDQDGIDVIEIVATPWVDTQQTTAPTMSSGFGGSSTMSPEAAAAKQKGEAYIKCMNDMYAAKTSCLTSVNNNLLSNQSTCTKVGVSMAGVTAGVGILISLTGVGTIPGAAITTAAGATGGMIYNQCNNVAQNISNNGKEACEFAFNQTKLKCDAIKP